MLYFVGDIHGDYDGLMQAMNNVNFDKVNDTLICCGDLVDKGYQNERVVDLLKEDWFEAVRGNHDQYVIDAVNNPLFDRNSHRTNSGGEWLYVLPNFIKVILAKSLSQLPIVREIEYNGRRFGIVHAEVPFNYNNWLDFTYDVDNEDVIALQAALLGGDVIKYPENAPILEGIDFVVHGHNAIPKPFMINNRVWLDTKDYQLPIVIVSAEEIINNRVGEQDD